jgi:hypothetical protein
MYPGVNWIYVLVMYCIDFSTQPRELKHEPAAFYKGRHSTGGLCTPSSGFRQKRRLSPWTGTWIRITGSRLWRFLLWTSQLKYYSWWIEETSTVSVQASCKEHFLRYKSSVFIQHIRANLPIMSKSQTRESCVGIFKQSMGARNRVGIGLSYQSPYMQSF